MKNFLKLTIIFTVFLVKTLNVNADLIGNLVLDPENPGPHEQVNVTLVSYDFDVNNSNISWFVNGKTISSGPGVKKITLTTGDVGTGINILAKASVPGGQIFQANMNLIPASVDLTWESSESFIPPFYEGRSQPAEGALVRINATPNMSSDGKILSPSDVSYAWYKNDEFIESASGRGYSTLDTTLEYLTDVTTIKVIAHAPDGTTATKSVDIYPHAIIPIFYLYDPILGTELNNAITKRFETTKDFTLKFVPYFFSLNGSAGNNATFSWSIDGLPITTADDTTISLRPKENSYGSKTLDVSIENSSRILQNLSTVLNIVFDTRK